MKKIISLILTTCILGALVVSLSGCGLFKKKIDSGTEAAKLLLANERLNSSYLDNSLELGTSVSSPEVRSTLRSLSEKEYAEIFWDGSESQASASDLARAIVPVEDGREYTWTDFGKAYSSSMVEFTQFIDSVEFQAERVAEELEAMKNKVGVVDKWVTTMFSTEKRMLRVFESSEMLLVKDREDLNVYYRYTSDNAKNVYEMYSFVNYQDGTTGLIKTLLIPGERCEYSFEDGRGFGDYFIAENTRGYWTATRFSYNKEYSSASFHPYAIKDGLGFGTYASVYENFRDETISYFIFDPNTNRDLFRIYEYEDFYSFGVALPAIKSGLVSLSGHPEYYDDEENVYSGNDIYEMVTENGVYSASHGENGQFAFSRAEIDYDYYYQVYRGYVFFDIYHTSASVYDAYEAFGNYLSEIGISLHCDLDTIAKSLELASTLSSNFIDTLEWNGYTLNTVENVEAAIQVYKSDLEKAYEDYELVKDYETVNSRQKLSNDAKFADLEILSVGENTFDGNVIYISDISSLISDTALFENGTEYVLKVGLSLIDENGNPTSVNTVPLAGGTTDGTAFTGSPITLLQGGTFALPKNLDSGEYCVVIYAATKNEGIRVSEMEKVAFLEIKEGEIESSAMHIEATKRDGNLILKYSIKNIRYIEMEATKQSYSYKEIRRVIMTEALAHGAPYSGAVLEYEDGTQIEDGASLGTGVYRMMAYLMTSDGLAQSYIYLTVK